MYNKGTIIIGLAIFVVLVTFPLWFNGLTAGTDMPTPVPPPGGETQCVLPAKEMRDNHMQVLDQWRDEVLRDGGRVSVTVGGKEYRKGLQTACMQCHTNKEQFCDPCHTYASVKPYCWDCHLAPAEAASKEEVK